MLFIFLSSFACTRIGTVDSPDGLVLEVRFDKEIHVSLTNKSYSDKLLMLPLNVTMDESGSGVEYIIVNSLNRRYDLCSNVNPIRATEVEKLGVGEKAEASYSVKTIARMYCLDSGDYKITANYHNVIDRGDKFSVSSNPITIYVSADMAYGRK